MSKTLAPGYRVDWLAGGRWRDQILRLKFSHTLACPTLSGMAVAEFLASGGYDCHLRRPRAELATNVERYREYIATEFPEGTRGRGAASRLRAVGRAATRSRRV